MVSKIGALAMVGPPRPLPYNAVGVHGRCHRVGHGKMQWGRPKGCPKVPSKWWTGDGFGSQGLPSGNLTVGY